MTTTTSTAHCRTVLCTGCGRWIISMSNVAPVEPFVCMWCETPPVSDEIASLKATIDNLRREARQDREQIKELNETIKLHETCAKCLREWANRYQTIAEARVKVPHRCPVCMGAGFVPTGFYSGAVATNTARCECRSCSGNGLVWS